MIGGDTDTTIYVHVYVYVYEARLYDLETHTMIFPTT